MNADLLQAFVRNTTGLTIQNVVVLQHGEQVAQYDWEPDARRNIYSATKSFTSTAVGMAIDEGLFRLDDKIARLFAKDMPENPCEELRMLTVRDLLKMAVGQQRPLLMAEERHAMKETDWVAFALAQPFVCQPGSRFQYTNMSGYLCGVLIQRLTGQSLVDYLTPRLFEPLGIPRPVWETCPKGYNFGAGGLELNTQELARFGQLYLQRGLWRGRRLVPDWWVAEATAYQISPGGKLDNGMGYGYQFWRGQHNSFRADGKYGQFSIVLPDKDAVVAIESHEEHNTQGILTHVWEDILPLL